MKKTRTGLNTTKALMTGAAIISLSAAVMSEAQAATGTGAMSAIVLTPIVVSGTVDLNFGSITESSAGTIVVPPVAAASVTGGVTSLSTPVVGVIQIAAATGAAITLSMDATAYTVSDGLANTMSVNNFNLVTDAGGTSETITLAASPETRPLGATLNVSAGQTPGTYTGNYTVNANYQ